MVDRGLVESRERARALVLAGKVRVGGVTATKAGTFVGPDTRIELVLPDHPYVSRGGVKLAAALAALAVPIAGRHALDIGASTGGFTDALLQHGAVSVVALDVGRNQLAWRLRTDPRVTVIEGVNARHLRAADLPPDRRRFDLVTVDVAFISVRHILPVIPALLAPDADVVVLVKPQFEAGRREVGKGGIVREPATHARVVRDVAAAAATIGLGEAGRTAASITGAEGNQEFFLHLRREIEAT